MSADQIQRLLDKDAIRDVIFRYCRGLDRMDREMASSVFHPDSQVEYFDVYEGSGQGFIDWVWTAHAACERHFHQVSNCLIEVAGDEALSETYVTVALWTLPATGGDPMEIISRNRYVDRWCKDESGWSILRRLCIADLQSVSEFNRGDVNAESARDKSDASYRLLNSRF